MKMKIKKIVLSVALFLVLMALPARAQHFSVSTNTLDWANLGTINLEAGVSLAQHFSLHVGGRYNPWTFQQKDPYMIIREKQKSAYVGARWWAWYVYTGWWVGAKVQYSDFEVTGIWRPAVDRGKALGLGLSAGYTFMISEQFNFELGLGLWGGYLLDYQLLYSPAREDVRASGSRPFIQPDILSASFIYVF